MHETQYWIERRGERIDRWGAFGSEEIEPGDICVIKRPNQPEERFEYIRKIQYKSMVPGGIYGESYNAYNTGFDVFVFDGFSDVTPKYGEGGPRYPNITAIQQKYDVHNLNQVEYLGDKLDMEYGHGIYLCTTSLTMGLSGCYYYVFKGRWSRGSGAEPLTFWEVRRLS
jgi:hypothetical protein